MTEERIITAATITTGEKNDGKELVTQGNRQKEDDFSFNKDAGMYVNAKNKIIF